MKRRKEDFAAGCCFLDAATPEKYEKPHRSGSNNVIVKAMRLEITSAFLEGV